MSVRARIVGVTLLCLGVTLTLSLAMCVREPDSPSSERPVATEADAVTVGEGARCDHPYVPTRVGETRTYRWESTTGAGRISMRLVSSTDSERGISLRWRVDGDDELVLDRHCDADGAEEPWLALGGAAPVALEDQSWRLPRRLEANDRYAGTFTARILSMAVHVTRTHRVAARERLTVSGQRYDAFRVEVEEQAPHGAAVPSTQWIAEGIGLVQMWLGPEEYRTEFRLESFERAAPPGGP